MLRTESRDRPKTSRRRRVDDLPEKFKTRLVTQGGTAASLKN